jgi:hypothetical protein
VVAGDGISRADVELASLLGARLALALTYVCVLGLIGALSYIFIVGPVERVTIETSA